MIKYSVKKPFTVIVAVIIVMIIGAVSLMRIETSLLPDMDLPYMLVITTYPGASPEKVEENVTKLLESSLGTVSGVENVTSISGENYSAITLEFSDGTDMDSAMVKVSSAVNQIESSLPEEAGTPNIMEISMDMVATMYVSVSYSGMDIYELSDFVEETITPTFERQEGVASVTETGLVEQTIEVRLDQDKIDDINGELLLQVNDKLDEAKKELNAASSEISSAEKKLNEQEAALKSQQESATDELAEATLALDQAEAAKSAYTANLNGLQASKTALEAEKSAYVDNGVTTSYSSLNTMFSTIYSTVSAMDSTTLAYIQAAMETAGYSDFTASSLPTSVKDAIDNPTKLATLKAFVGVMATMDSSYSTYASSISALTTDSLSQLYQIVEVRIPQIDTEIANLNTEIVAAQAVLDALNNQIGDLDSAYKAAEQGKISAAAGFGSASAQIASGRTALADAKEQLEEATADFEEAEKAALENANIDTLLEIDTLAALVYAQNFSMPAGYIDDEEDNQWLLKVGENYESIEDLENMVLVSLDGIGDVTLGDVATITVIDNAGESYAKVNGDLGILLSIYKSSTAGTSDVSDLTNATIEELESEYEGLSIVALMDQGDYIDILIKNIFTSMVQGALLAVLILAILLLDIRPTLVVAFSIPFSVLTALVFMYFTDISINMMSLFGISLAIGMLVDNSVVVIENIYRLRYRGLSAARSSVQGAKQVAAPIISSTLTTICVFFPIVFTTGLVRQLMLPFSLTITYSLVASLLVALTVVPVFASFLLKRVQPKQHKIFEKIQNVYGTILAWCLRFKIVPLAIAIVLLIFTIRAVFEMGVVLLPDAGSTQIQMTAVMPEEDDTDTVYEKADAIMDALLEVEGVAYIGAMDGGSSSGIMGSFLSSDSSSSNTITAFIIPEEDLTTTKELNTLVSNLQEAASDFDAEITITNSMMGDMDTLLGSGLELQISGSDLETLVSVSEDIMEIVGEVEGFTNITNGQEEASEELILILDKDELRRLGVTEAQIYQEILDALSTTATATTLTIDDADMEVTIINENHLLTKENLLDFTFTASVLDEEGNTVEESHTLSEVGTVEYSVGMNAVDRENGSRYISVTADVADGYNLNLLTRTLETKLASYEFPKGYSYSFGGETENIEKMLSQMMLLMLLGAVLIYLVMVAQFQSLLSPFIVIFTVPLAFTGGLLGMLATNTQMSLVTLMGFLVLMGTVVNNGIVFVDYTNQLRLGGMKKRDALIATGKVRMRPIFMTALTTILAMLAMVFSQEASSEMGKGMAIVVAAGLAYATLMTLFIVPIMYDILYRKQPRVIDVGDDNLDDVPDDAAEFLEKQREEGV